jgi:hypothetical protein
MTEAQRLIHEGQSGSDEEQKLEPGRLRPAGESFRRFQARTTDRLMRGQDSMCSMAPLFFSAPRPHVTIFFSFANGLSPSHVCIFDASCLSPTSFR